MSIRVRQKMRESDHRTDLKRGPVWGEEGRRPGGRVLTLKAAETRSTEDGYDCGRGYQESLLKQGYCGSEQQNF